MKLSFQETDEIKDMRDSEFLNQFEENVGECQECGKSWYFCTCSGWVNLDD